MISLQRFIFSPFSENTYVIWDEDTLETAIIDPGCYSANEEKELFDFINSGELEVKYLINTHCHLDHIFGNSFVKSSFNPLFIAPELDLPLLKDAASQAEMFGLKIKKSPVPDHFITESLIVNIGKCVPKFIFTPGHTPGEYCIYIDEHNLCFTGDVLFYEGIGRTDLWGGNYETLMHSIGNKLLALPEQTIIYPGHGEKSSIGHEKVFNPFLN